MRVVFFLLLLCFSSFAQTQLQEAASLARAGHYEEANARLSDAPEPGETSQRIAFHRLKAAIASGLGKREAALNEMEAALRLAPSNPPLLTGTALAEQQAGHLDQALSLAQRAGEDATAKAIIGDVREKRGQFNEAVEAYRQAVSLDPSRASYRAALGLVLIEHGAFDQAREVLRPSLSLFPRSGVLPTLLAIAVYAGGEGKEAEQILQGAITADPKYLPAYRCLSKIVLESSTIPAEKTVSVLCPWDGVVCNVLQLRAARESGDEKLMSRAIESLARTSSKSDAVSRCALGQAYEWRRQLGQARGEMEACVKLDPSPQNRYRLGLLYNKLGAPELARKEFEARKKLLQKMSEETAAVSSALQAFGKTGK